MRHLQIYENFSTDEMLLESNRNIYRSIQDKTIKKLALNLYFVGTFQMGVTILYPIVEALVNNSDIPQIITPEHIVLMTIFSIAQILNVNTEDVKKIKTELEKDNLVEVTEKVKISLQSIYKIFSYVAKRFNKIVDVFTDVLAYVALGTPFYLALLEMISKEGLNLDTLPQKVLVFGTGVAIFAFKSFAEAIVNIIKNKMNKN